MQPLDRVDDESASVIADAIEQSAPPAELVEDIFTVLGYLTLPDALPEIQTQLLRRIATSTGTKRQRPRTVPASHEQSSNASDQAPSGMMNARRASRHPPCRSIWEKRSWPSATDPTTRIG